MTPTPGSETSAVADVLAPYCTGIGVDMGYGGMKIVPTAWAFDMPTPYVKLPHDRQQLRGTCENLSFICDGALDYIYSSHLLEDFTYQHLATVIIPEWRRVLKQGGLLIINCPDQQRFVSHCQKTGQPMNAAHKESDFSLKTFQQNVLNQTGPWFTDLEEPSHGAYSWLLVTCKT